MRFLRSTRPTAFNNLAVIDYSNDEDSHAVASLARLFSRLQRRNSLARLLLRHSACFRLMRPSVLLQTALFSAPHRRRVPEISRMPRHFFAVLHAKRCRSSISQTAWLLKHSLRFPERILGFRLKYERTLEPMLRLSPLEAIVHLISRNPVLHAFVKPLTPSFSFSALFGDNTSSFSKKRDILKICNFLLAICNFL